MSHDMPQDFVPPPAPYPGVAPPSGATPPTHDERQTAMLIHLLQFAGYIVPLGNIIGPLILWMMKKDTSRFADWHGKTVLNFQITMMIVTIILGLVTLVTCGIGIVLLIPFLIYEIVIMIIGTMRANAGLWWQYPAVFNFIS